MELPANFLSLGRGFVKLVSEQVYAIVRLFFVRFPQYFL